MLIGVDYGTTTSLAISWKNGILHEESRILSSVFVDENKRILTDEAAYRNLSSQNGNYILSPKSLLKSNDNFSGNGDGDLPNPKEMVTETLTHLFRNISIHDNSPVHITLTVPNAWRDNQYMLMRECVVNAAKSVFGGRFNKDAFAIIPEPVAAALHFITHKEMAGDEDKNYIVICDIGGGTTDIAAVKYQKYRGDNGFDLYFDVVCPLEGDHELGGDVFDKALLNHLLPHGIPYDVPDFVAWNQIKALKAQLSRREFGQVPLLKKDGTLLKDGWNNPVYLKCTRAQFEALISPYLDKLKRMLVKLATKMKELDCRCDLSRVYLLPVGGSCRIPVIRKTLREVFPAQINDMEGEKNGYYDSIASGAACYSAISEKVFRGYNDIEIANRTAHRLALKHGDNALETWVEKNSPDGDYHPRELNPAEWVEEGVSFHVGKIAFYQGEGHTVDEELNVYNGGFTVPDMLYSHGKALESIPASLNVHIKQSRIESIKLVVKWGNEDGSDFVFLKDFSKE